MKDTLKNIIQSLVENKDVVEITEESNEYGITLYIKVADSDIGRIIGKHGKTISALRTVFKAAGLKNKQNIRLEIIDQKQPENKQNMEETPVTEENVIPNESAVNTSIPENDDSGLIFGQTDMESTPTVENTTEDQTV